MAIHQEIHFNCNVQSIFAALTLSDKFSAFSDAPAHIAAEAGGAFSCFGGLITGITLELIPTVRLVQAWRVANWDEGIYSVVRFEFEETGASEAKIVFDHTAYPAEHEEHLSSGWHAQYWDRMKSYLGS